MTPNSQAVKDVAASHEALIHLFERIHLFLQRLNRYTGMPLTGDMSELLGKIMSQVLTILALSTKEMMDRRISELNCPLWHSSMANYGAEKILKKLAGRTNVEDAVLQLDMLTKDESLMVVVRNLEVTHRVDGNVEATKVLAEDIDDNVKATKALTEDIGDNVNATKECTQCPCPSVYILTSRSTPNQSQMRSNVRHFPTASSLNVKANIRSQEIS